MFSTDSYITDNFGKKYVFGYQVCKCIFTEIMLYWFFFKISRVFLCHGWSSLLEYNFESGGKLCVNNFSNAEKFHPFSNWIFYYGPLKSQEHFDHQIVEHLHKKKEFKLVLLELLSTDCFHFLSLSHTINVVNDLQNEQ